MLSTQKAIMNDNQNNFVTRSTSRVLSEPGGKSSTSFLFGGSTPANAVSVKPPAKATPKKTAVEPTTRAKTAAGGAVSPGVLSPFTAAARIKSKQETTSFSLFGGGGGAATTAAMGGSDATAVSSNAFASSSSTNSYNVLTDRSTSRVVSFSLFFISFRMIEWFDCAWGSFSPFFDENYRPAQSSSPTLPTSFFPSVPQLRPPGGQSSFKLG